MTRQDESNELSREDSPRSLPTQPVGRVSYIERHFHRRPVLRRRRRQASLAPRGGGVPGRGHQPGPARLGRGGGRHLRLITDLGGRTARLLPNPVTAVRIDNLTGRAVGPPPGWRAGR
jgi:hypothetical protein